MKIVRLGSTSDGFGLIETLVAITVLSIGLMAASGLSSGTTRLVTSASVLADQTAAAESVFEALRQAGYAAAVSRVDTLRVGSASYVVEVAVADLAPTTKQVVVSVSGKRAVAARQFTTWMASGGSFPPPAAPTADLPP